ncbi:MAG: peptidoglycan editing factor PgeF [Bdellovibrionales bacterium]
MSNEVLIAENLNALPNVRHAFFKRSWNDPKKMAAYLEVSPEHFLSCRQIHSSKVVSVKDVWNMNNAPEADALVTNRTGVALGILTADCVPVLFADPERSVIGAAHAGWRGALGGVLESTVEAMEGLGAHKKSIHAALGPCIWQDSYEVGSEFPEPFLAQTPLNERFFKRSIKKGKYQFDLQGFVINRLSDCGLASICPSPADTYADPDHYFSYRCSVQQGGEQKGRLLSAITLHY